MAPFLTRLKYRWLMLRHHGEELNRRTGIEQWLLACAAGKKPLPDANTCRWLALRLGTPKDYWGEYLRVPPNAGNNRHEPA